MLRLVGGRLKRFQIFHALMAAHFISQSISRTSSAPALAQSPCIVVIALSLLHPVSFIISSIAAVMLSVVIWSVAVMRLFYPPRLLLQGFFALLFILANQRQLHRGDKGPRFGFRRIRTRRPIHGGQHDSAIRAFVVTVSLHLGVVIRA